MARYLGVDLHRNCFTVCLIAANGRRYLKNWKLEQLSVFVKTLRPGDQVAVEITGNTRLFYDAVVEHVDRLVVVDAAQFQVIRKSTKKTDPHDAAALALYLSKDLLPEVRMKDAQHAELSSLLQTRDTLVKQRTALKNKINNLLSARGHNLRKEALGSEKGLKQALAIPLPPVTRVELAVLVGQIRSLNQALDELEKTVKEQARQLAGYENLKSIKGIGDVGAGVLLTAIGDIRHFAHPGKLAAYFGLVPRVHNSNETERCGRITKRGTKLGRTTVVQCALIAKRYSPYLARFYNQIQRRRGTGKAIVALAKKFLGVIYHTLANNWVFADFPNFELRVDTP